LLRRHWRFCAKNRVDPILNNRVICADENEIAESVDNDFQSGLSLRIARRCFGDLTEIEIKRSLR
jgi:hypothetical protein